LEWPGTQKAPEHTFLRSGYYRSTLRARQPSPHIGELGQPIHERSCTDALPGLYEKLGYFLFGELENLPSGDRGPSSWSFLLHYFHTP
jgi:hypothetical protein